MKQSDFEVPVRPYGKAELGHMYRGDDCKDRAARIWMDREISKCPGLREELRRLGYNTNQKDYTIAQVRAIFNAIGEPYFTAD